MTQAVRRLSWILIAVGTVAALAEAPWTSTLVCLAVGFAGLFVSSLALSSAADDDYRSAVIAYRQAGESTDPRMFHPAFGLAAVVLFLILSGASVYFDTPALVFGAVGLLVVMGLLWQHRRDQQRDQVWASFASEQGLAFHAGRVLDHLDNPRLIGTIGIRPVRLEVVRGRGDQRRGQFLVAVISVATGPASFCVDGPHLESALRQAPEIARQLFDWRELSEQIHALHPLRLSLCDESLSCHLPRVPRTRVELAFHCAVLQEMAGRLERAA